MFQTLYVASNVRNVDMDRVNLKKKAYASCVQKRAMMVTLVKMLTNIPIVPNPEWPLLKTVNFIQRKKIQAMKIERNISYPEAQIFVSMANGSLVQKYYASVTKPV
jgi:hypothetical protein